MTVAMRAALALALGASALHAASSDEFKRDCAAFGGAPGLNTFKSCAIDFFTLSPVHPIVEISPPDSVERRTASWPGMAAEML